MHWAEVRDLFRKWREETVRNSREVVELWESTLKQNVHKLGDEEYLVYEQVCIAALDCNRRDVAYLCAMDLVSAFPNSMRVRKLQALELDAEESYEDAFDVLDSIIKHDDTNAAPRKRLVAILKSCQRIPEAIKELNDYLKKFMSDQEAWQELSELYLLEQDYARAAFCLEELVMHSPHNHLIHQRYAEIRYTQGGLENYELARAHYCLCLKLNPSNIRALYGLLLSAVNIASNPKTSATKKKESNKLAIWAGQQIKERYEEVNKSKEDTTALEGLVSALQISISPPAITQ